MDKIVEDVIQVVAKYGLQVIGALLILIFGRIAAGIARKGTKKAMDKAGTDPTITGFVKQFAYIIVMVVAVLASLSKFGIQTTSFVAVLGAAGFAIGFALQGSLSHFAAGVMLLVFRPIRVGDFVEAGVVAVKAENVTGSPAVGGRVGREYQHVVYRVKKDHAALPLVLCRHRQILLASRRLAENGVRHGTFLFRSFKFRAFRNGN